MRLTTPDSIDIEEAFSKVVERVPQNLRIVESAESADEAKANDESSKQRQGRMMEMDA